MKKPFALYALIFLLAFLAMGGIYGGLSMLFDPSGNSLQVAEILPLLPIPDYTLPGIFLLLMMGFAPLFLAYALLVHLDWVWATRLTGWCNYHWAWLGTISLVVILTLWLLVEGFMIGFHWPIQYTTAVNGFLIFLFSLAPSVRRYYSG